MGVRPPSGDSDEPDVIEFGIAALEPKLEAADVEYPTDAAELGQRIGEVEVPYDASGNTLAVGDALDQLEGATFDSKRDVLNALHPIFERRREQSGSGIFSQLRSLVPF